MPNLAVLVSNMIPPEITVDGTLRAEFNSWTPDGKHSQGDLSIDFNANVSQLNAAIVAAAKARHTAVHGVVFGPADKTIIYCAPTVG